MEVKNLDVDKLYTNNCQKYVYEKQHSFQKTIT